ncbi:hypothetical protein RMB_01220 [Rickettsia massiliae str. AZT80]|uniref:Uncharacterized protein n=1 Tax=Rickettsia massiliae str. AZT80 TaxID=1105112 RepID=H6QL12_RICMA|nr:hypothetical protein RMB_01220 [Rickettsia massiliae str. AZT80]
MLLIILPDSLKKTVDVIPAKTHGCQLKEKVTPWLDHRVHIILVFLTRSRDQVGIVAWIGKPTRCHSRVGGNPEK